MHHRTGSFVTRDGLKLFTQSWLPETPEGSVVLVHGYAEHSGRYASFAEYLAARGFGVYAFDQRGHGNSGGRRVNVRVFREYATDLARYLERVREANPGLPRFLLGHSMGGLTALQLVLEHPHKADGLILSGCYVRNALPVPGALVSLAGLVSAVAPELPVQPLDPAVLSRDETVVRAYAADPLVYHGRVKARLGAELLRCGDYLLDRAESVKLPTLILHGGADRLAAMSGSRELYERLGSEDKALKVYDGFFHEILNEPGKEQVWADVVSWLEAHLD